MRLGNLMVVWSHSNTATRDTIKFCISARQSWRGSMVTIPEKISGSEKSIGGDVTISEIEPEHDVWTPEPLVLEVNNNFVKKYTLTRTKQSPLADKEKLAIFGHGTVYNGQGAFFIGTAGDFKNGGRRLMFAQELSHLLQAEGFKGKSIDLIACLSFHLAKDLSSRMKNVLIKGYTDPVRVDPPPFIMLTEEWNKIHKHKGKATMSGTTELRRQLKKGGVGLGSRDDQEMKHRYLNGKLIAKTQWISLKSKLKLQEFL